MHCVCVPTAGERREEYAQLNGGGGEGQEGLYSGGERGVCKYLMLSLIGLSLMKRLLGAAPVVAAALVFWTWFAE